METVRTAVTSVCVSLIFFGVVMLLLPEGVMHKSYKSFVSVAIIAALVSSFGSVSLSAEDIDPKTDINIASQSSQLAEKVTQQESLAVESAVSQLISENLNLKGVTDAEIYVSTDISEDNNIYITEVTVVCDAEKLDICRSVLDTMSITADIRERE